jgi:hypothetical protein
MPDGIQDDDPVKVRNYMKADMYVYVICILISSFIGMTISCSEGMEDIGRVIKWSLIGSFSMIELCISVVQLFYNGDSSKPRCFALVMSFAFSIPLILEIVYYLIHRPTIVYMLFGIVVSALILFIIINRRRN